MYAVASLGEGMEWAADTFGVPAAYGGEHVGLGTPNALLSLGSTYLEIIARSTSTQRISSGWTLSLWAARATIFSVTVIPIFDNLPRIDFDRSLLQTHPTTACQNGF